MSQALTKYVGSKRWLVDGRPDAFPMPEPGGLVAVPFVGGGSIAALYGARGARVIASDLNARLVHTHREVQRNVETVIDALGYLAQALRLEDRQGADELAGRAFFEDQRSRLDQDEPALRAARFIFVVRGGFNGLYRENASGDCTTAYGKPPASRDLVAADELRAYAAAVQGVEFLHEDFAITGARVRPGGVFVGDPPYEGTFTGYCGGNWEASQMALPGLGQTSDRERLAALLGYFDAIGVRWTLSDSDTPTTRRLYAKWAVEVVSRKGTVSCDGEGRADVPELLVRNWRSVR